MRAKFEGNPITHFCLLAVFLQVCEKEEEKETKRKTKTKKISNFLKAYISGMSSTIYFRSGICFLPICQHLHSECGLVWTRDHEATNACKIVLCCLC